MLVPLLVAALTLAGRPLEPGAVGVAYDGQPLRLQATGLPSRETVVVHAFRTLSKWNGSAYVDVPMHAWAEMRAARDGSLDVDATKPRRGSYRAASGRALLWSAYPYRAIPGVLTSHSEIPVETILRARDWLAARPEADASRFGLLGVSKGAEFAVLAAATYPWVRAVVALVPSDVVWEGYKGEGGESGTSSWSVESRPFPYVPLYGVDAKRFRTNTDRYRDSRRDHPKEAKAAEIPVERSKARFLLLGSDRDEVWASGPMARLLARRLRGRAETVVFPQAGHQLSGTATFPTRLYGVPSKDPRDKDLNAEGEAAERSWEKTLDFLKRTL